jgi:two-component system, cell cycle sensor histidine kinase and response regulator CckA
MIKRKSTGPAPPVPGLVYVVDDSPMLSELAATVLESAGYSVRYFTDPKVVIEAFNEAGPKPDVLVTDYDMGEINGVELVRQLHKVHPSLKTVLLSGTVSNSMMSMHPGEVHRFLGKPYDPAQLKNLVAELLQT